MAEKDYNVNFFKPKTDHAKANMKVVFTMVIIWAVAVFGFQLLLNSGLKLTPEESYKTYEKVKPAIEGGTATPEEQKDFARVTLMVLGKHIMLKDGDKKVLKNCLDRTVKDLMTKTSAATAEAAIGLGDKGFDPLLKDILAASYPAPAPEKDAKVESPEDEMKKIPAIMKLYLVHNRSALTDTPFLGFPFHYWYTAQFLLILFVGLCWLFCKITDKSNKTYNLETETE